MAVKIYKKTFYIGSRKILSLKRRDLINTATRAILIIITTIMLLTMVFGGLAMILTREQTVSTNNGIVTIPAK